jgi:Spy/CpxP family protein refolding chaperone
MMSPGMGYGAGMGFPFRRLSDLDLTSEQRARIVEMLTANYKAMLEAGFMVNDAVSKLRELRGGGAGDEALIAAHRNLGEAMGRLQSLRGKAKEQIKDVLTDEQKAKLGKPGRRERFDDDRGCDYRGCDDRRPRDRRDDDRRWGGRRHRDRWDDIPRWDRRPPRDRRQNAGDDDVDDVDSLLDDDAVEDALEDALED